MAKFRIVGISFDHMHMGDLLRLVHDHPDAEIVGLFDPDRSRMDPAVAEFAIPEACVFTDFDACMRSARPDLAILCAATADHARYTERLAAYGVHVFVEKPFAASVADARAMIAAMQPAGKLLAINWPLAWVPSHVTAKRLIDEGLIGALTEVHFYDGNRGPLYHLADKIEVSPAEVEAQKPTSWWYKRASGGGSLLDYMGYGATLGTWYMDGKAPVEITCTVDQTAGI
jgi:predicted dehydrogenase